MTPAVLKARAQFIGEIRAFFADLGVIEVQTPCLRSATVTDRHVHSLSVTGEHHRGFLQTSPEYAMKVLLSQGAGAIYQMGPCFRDDPDGRLHRGEFTMLEWYRPGFDHHQLMDEVARLVEVLLARQVKRISYWTAMTEYAALSWDCSLQACQPRLGSLGLSSASRDSLSLDDALDLVLSQCVAPQLGACLIYDYPASQCALARVREDNPPVAERFELYVDGIELANGYHELTDLNTHKIRFNQDRERRDQAGTQVPSIDPELMAALEVGLPICSGVAVGVDRLFMLQQGKRSLEGLVL